MVTYDRSLNARSAAPWTHDPTGPSTLPPPSLALREARSRWDHPWIGLHHHGGIHGIFICERCGATS